MGIVDKAFTYYARIGDNRVINGLMHIIVRNDMDTKDDAIEEYWSHTAGGASGNPDSGAKAAAPFNNSDIADDPGRTGHLKGIGDYDSFLYFVTIAGNLQVHETNGSVLGGQHTGSDGASVLTTSGLVNGGVVGQIVQNTTDGSQGIITANTATTVTCSGGLSGGTDNDWDTDDVYQICNQPEAQPWFTAAPSHLKCQSFVRYQLLGRHNNTDGHDNQNYLHFGIPVPEYGNSAAGDSTETILVEQNKVGSDSRLVVNQGVFSSQNFGSNLSALNSNNTFFKPVRMIEIYGHHPAPTYDTSTSGQFKSGTTHYALTLHDASFYNLVVDIDLHGYVNPEGNTVSFFRNKVNIFFQPFGETTEIKFSQSPGTPFTS
jgi:hypothetical protein